MSSSLMSSRINLLVIFIVCLLIPAGAFAWGVRTATVTVDDSTRFQTMEGWGGSIGGLGIPVHEWTENPTPEFYDSTPVEDLVPDEMKAELAKAIVETLGLNRFRLEVGPQVEMVPGEFRFAWQDFKVEKWILPIKRLLDKRGERMVLYISYDLGSSHTPAWLLEPENYARMAVRFLTHLRDDYGLEPDYWSVLNEPGNHRPGDPRSVARLIAVTGRAIHDAGFSTRMSGPEVVTPSQIKDYVRAIRKEPGAAKVFGQLTYHLYWDPANTVSRNIARKHARELGITTAQTEWLEGRGLTTVEALYLDLTEADAVSWEQYGIFFTSNNYNRTGGGDYIVIDPGFKSFRINTNAWYIGEYSRRVRPGDVRVESVSTDKHIKPVAFVRPDGRHSVVVINRANLEREVTIEGIADGRYSVGMTGPAGLGMERGTVTAEGNNLTYRIPGRTVVSFTGASD